MERVIPGYVTHYFEADRGPFLNICDLAEDEAAAMAEVEAEFPTAFNRFAMGDVFLKWRREADDLLARAYGEKFGKAPEGRPYFALLGAFDRTLSMFRSGSKLELDLAGFGKEEVTFMYPDHAHLLSVYESGGTRLFYDFPPRTENEGFFGKLFTLAELAESYVSSGIAAEIEGHQRRGSWAGSYVEAHLWKRSLREEWTAR